MVKMSEEICVSVIIPVYNAAPYLPACIASVQAQSLTDLEILCVDDGSTDQSLAVLEQLAQKDARVRIFRQPNRSAGAARNLGLSRARGEYVHFLDADDRLRGEVYAPLTRALADSGAQVCVFQFETWDASEEKRESLSRLSRGGERLSSLGEEPAIYLYNAVVPWNKLYRRSWLREHGLRFDEIRCANDRAFYFRLLATEPQFYLSELCGVRYYVNRKNGALTGDGRYRHFDCLFYAWEGAERAFAAQPAQVRAMLLDATVTDFLDVLDKTPSGEREAVSKTLGTYLRGMDMSALAALPYPCAWAEDYRRLLAGREDWHRAGGLRRMLARRWAGLQIWGPGYYLARVRERLTGGGKPRGQAERGEVN